jgi:hypothetical protein
MMEAVSAFETSTRLHGTTFQKTAIRMPGRLLWDKGCRNVVLLVVELYFATMLIHAVGFHHIRNSALFSDVCK